MSEKILVPVLGESITEATVSKWLKKEGDNVEEEEDGDDIEEENNWDIISDGNWGIHNAFLPGMNSQLPAIPLETMTNISTSNNYKATPRKITDKIKAHGYTLEDIIVLWTWRVDRMNPKYNQRYLENMRDDIADLIKMPFKISLSLYLLTQRLLMESLTTIGVRFFRKLTPEGPRVGRACGRPDGRTVGRTDGRTRGRTDGRTGGRTDRRTGGRADDSM